jgi:hypothetical protein
MATETAREEHEKRVGKNQALFRDVNELVSAINKAHDLWLTLSDWICECADGTCIERMELSPEQYERVRKNPNHFAVVPGEEHVVPGVERIVEQHERYWVIEVGKAAAVTTRLDPRS